MFKSRSASLGAFVLLNFVLTFLSPASALENCNNVGSDYKRAVESFQPNSSGANERFKEIVNMRKMAETLQKECIKSINLEFKNTLKAINNRYQKSAGNKEDNFAQKTKKNNEIAAATLQRDTRIKDLMSLPELPQKPVKIEGKKRNR